jgi:hypothetical protein
MVLFLPHVHYFYLEVWLVTVALQMGSVYVPNNLTALMRTVVAAAMKYIQKQKSITTLDLFLIHSIIGLVCAPAVSADLLFFSTSLDTCYTAPILICNVQWCC